MGETPVVYTRTDERGKVFNLKADIPKVIEALKDLALGEEYDEGYSLESCADYDGTPVTQSDRDKEVSEIKQFIVQLQEKQGLEEWFDRIPFKKNGTFHKARVVTLFRGMTFEHYWEDSYGYNGPELLIRTLDDHNAVLSVEDRVRKQ
jgi:hypothetical protein